MMRLRYGCVELALTLCSAAEVRQKGLVVRLARPVFLALWSGKAGLGRDAWLLVKQSMVLK